MPRTCLFCPNRPTSKEHAWPDWVLKWVGESKPATIHAWFGPDAPEKVWADRDITVKYICVPCNTGWMSDLESIAIPVLRPLMTDFEMRLDRARQLIASIWTTKTAMVFEATNPTKDWYYQQPERDAMASSLAIPTGTMIWVGRSFDRHALFAVSRRMRNPVTKHQHVLSEGYVTTFVLGRLILQAISLRRFKGFERYNVQLSTRPGPWAQSLIKIHPSGSAAPKWPPPISFGGLGGPTYDDLADRFFVT